MNSGLTYSRVLIIFAVVVMYYLLTDVLNLWLPIPLAAGIAFLSVTLLSYPFRFAKKDYNFTQWAGICFRYSLVIILLFYMGRMIKSILRV